MSPDTTPRRRYDASRRREQAAATRHRIVEAAAELFVERGYAGTTIPAIAAGAGVAVETVYRSAAGKAGLLAAAVQAALAGGVERSERPVEQREGIRRVIEEPDPRRQLAAYAHTQPGLWTRVGPLLRVLDSAASSDPALQRLQSELATQRLDGMRRLADFLDGQGRLRPGTSGRAGGRPGLDPLRPGQLRRAGRAARLDASRVRVVAGRHARGGPLARVGHPGSSQVPRRSVRSMELGIHLANFTWSGGPSTFVADLTRTAKLAEDVGVRKLSVMDHVWQIGHIGPKEHEMLEAYTTLGYLAAVTERVELLAWVTAAVYREPGLLAKEVTTLDVLSGGRAWLGIGAAWNEEESVGLGLPFPATAERFERLEETLQICLQMWSDSEAPYDGRHYTLGRTLNSPQSVQRPHPPILIGGGGEKKTLRMVAQYADACNLFDSPELRTSSTCSASTARTSAATTTRSPRR